MKIMIYDYDVSKWKYLYYKYLDVNGSTWIAESVRLDEIKLNKISNSPVELLLYNLNIQELPKVMNIMAKQSSYGLDKVIGIKSSFDISDTVDGVKTDYVGSIIKIYVPNFRYHENNKSEFKIGSSKIYVLNDSKNLLDPLAVIGVESSDEINSRIYDNIVSHEDITEDDHKRVMTIIIGSGNGINKTSELLSHVQDKFNEHQGQSSLVFSDLRRGTYISKLFQSIIATDKRLSSVSNTCIARDFTKQYLGSNTIIPVTNYIITSQSSEIIGTESGDKLIYI